jgi:propanol-preferring alcohol dehydrogenase
VRRLPAPTCTSSKAISLPAGCLSSPGTRWSAASPASGAGAVRFRPGDRVGIAWLRETCGTCASCRGGRENLCDGSRYTGWDADGGYAAAAIVHEDFAYPIPAALSDADAAPLLCAGIIGYRALRRARVEPGQKLGLYGFGSSAHIVAQIARSRGCEVYVATRDASHRRLAEELGAVWTATRSKHRRFRSTARSSSLRRERSSRRRCEAWARGNAGLAGIHMSDLPPMSYDACLFHEKTLTSVESNTRADGEELLREAEAIGLAPASRRSAERSQRGAARAGRRRRPRDRGSRPLDPGTLWPDAAAHRTRHRGQRRDGAPPSSPRSGIEVTSWSRSTSRRLRRRTPRAAARRSSEAWSTRR